MNSNEIFKTLGEIVNKTHRSTDFIQKSSLLHVVISFLIWYDKSLHPVVIHENNLICISMNIYKKETNKGNL